MRYLTLELCKHHAYIDHSEDDNLVEIYASAAENAVENYLECPLASKEVDGKLPEDLLNAMLLLFGSLYANREGITTMTTQPNAAIAALLKPHKSYGTQRW